MHSTVLLEELGKLPKSTPIVGDVDQKTKSPFPHVYDYKSNQLFLIDTGAEISVVTPNQEDKNTRTSDRPLVAANGSFITTYGNRRMTLQLDSGNKITWTFVVAVVSYNIIGIDLMQHFSFTLDLQRKCFWTKTDSTFQNIIQKRCSVTNAPKVFLVK